MKAMKKKVITTSLKDGNTSCNQEHFLQEIFLILPLIVCAVAPKRSAELVTTAVDWLEQYDRVIVIVVSLTFGTFFLWKGISALLD